MAAQLWPLLMLDVGRPFRDAHCFVPQTEADVSTPVAEQSIGPDTPYPVLHVGWHCAPVARALVHEPRLPLVGAVTAHGAYVGERVGTYVMTATPSILSNATLSVVVCWTCAPE